MVHERPYSHKKHSTIFLRQGAGVPSLHAAPFGVEVSFQWIFKINETLEMSPGQFSQQRGEYFLVWKDRCEPDHVRKGFFRELLAEVCRQLSPHCGDSFLTVLRTLFLENVLPNSLPYIPIKGHQGRIDPSGDVLPALLNHRPEITEQNTLASGCSSER